MATERLSIPLVGSSVEVARSGEWSPTWADALGDARLRGAAYAAAKRALDITVAVTFLVLLLPILLLIGLAICLESKGPALYRGERVGRFGRTFRVAKFRSMRAGCDSAPHMAYIRSLMRDGSGPSALYKVPDDARITRIGHFLRRTSLDELPQLWNVLRGEMSLVGPRPDVPYAVEEYDDGLHRRLLVKPGISGLWQVSGRSRLSLTDMYRLDIAYVAQASLWLDLVILARTVPVVLGRSGAA
jgi:lipopolysaccharide/colanic/teichoic acid biosynthesis glycosyltransferase